MQYAGLRVEMDDPRFGWLSVVGRRCVVTLEDFEKIDIRVGVVTEIMPCM
jgi:hypothetical protein